MKVYVVRVTYNWLDTPEEVCDFNDCVFSTLESAIDYIESKGFEKNEKIIQREYEPLGVWESEPKFDDDRRTIMGIDEFDLLY